MTIAQQELPDALVGLREDSHQQQVEGQCLLTLSTGEVANHLNGDWVVKFTEPPPGTEVQADVYVKLHLEPPPGTYCRPIERPDPSPPPGGGSMPDVDLNPDVDKPWICRHTKYC
jgi:hypothetical protein